MEITFQYKKLGVAVWNFGNWHCCFPYHSWEYTSQQLILKFHSVSVNGTIVRSPSVGIVFYNHPVCFKHSAHYLIPLNRRKNKIISAIISSIVKLIVRCMQSQWKVVWNSKTLAHLLNCLQIYLFLQKRTLICPKRLIIDSHFIFYTHQILCSFSNE